VLCGSRNGQRLFPYAALTDYLEDLAIDGSITLKLILKFRIGSNSTFCPQCIRVFYVDHGTDNDYFPIQH